VDFKPSFAALFIFAVSLFVLLGGLCKEVGLSFSGGSEQPPAPVAAPLTVTTPRIVLQRLHVAYWGQDGATFIGSGCPGRDGKGVLVDYHFTVDGVDTSRAVTRILVAGNDSTVTWEWPCGHTWGLHAVDQGDGFWDIYVAPSEPTEVYTVVFFYDDNSMAMGMVEVDQ
jgi:hypothetical protein